MHRVNFILFIFLFLMNTSNPVYGILFQDNSPFNGFYVGLHGGLNQVSGYNRMSAISDQTSIFFDRAIFENTLLSYGGTAGLHIGYGFIINHGQYVGVALSGNLSSNEITKPWTPNDEVFDDSDFITVKTCLRYYSDFSLIYGILINPVNLFYFKAGSTLASFKMDTRLIDPINPANNSEDKQKEALWGFQAGIGLKHNFNNCINLFFESIFHTYQKLTLDTIPAFYPRFPNGFLQDRANKFYSFDFVVGISIALRKR